MESFDDGQQVTSFENICKILADLWLNYRSDKEFKDFIEYNDIGLPLAFFIDSELVEHTELAQQYVVETWNIFLAALGIEDSGWENLQEMFNNIKE